VSATRDPGDFVCFEFNLVKDLLNFVFKRNPSCGSTINENRTVRGSRKTMPFEAKKDDEHNLIIHVGHGQIHFADIEAELAACFGEEGWTRHSLWDLRDANLTLLSAEEVRTLAQRAVSYARKHAGVKNAWVAVAASDFGLCRMSEMLADGVGLSLAVFHDYDEGLRWIIT